jgi:urocanate hydratase
MRLNNLDEQAAENPEELVVYDGMGDAARNTKALQKMIEILLELDKHHSVLVQSANLQLSCRIAI